MYHKNFFKKKESGMYQAVGMEKSKLIKVFIYEGLIIGLTSVLLSILFKCLPSLIEIANDANLTLSDFRIKYVFPPTIRWICLGIYVFVIAIFFIIYYFPTKNLLKEKMLDRVKYKE